MKKDNVTFGIIGLLAGVLIAGFAASMAVNNNNTGMMRMMGMDLNSMHKPSADDHGTMSMSDMTTQLEQKTGDDFDQAFLEMMIVHHEGAVDMAKLIPSRTKHDELKKLGEDIISAQTKEISEMRQWQKDWSYHDSETIQMMRGSH